MSRHRSRALTRALVDDAALIVVMTRTHRAAVIREFPAAADKVRLLTSFAMTGQAEDIEDPLGLPVEAYRDARDQMNAVLPNLVLYLHERFGGKAGPGRVAG